MNTIPKIALVAFTAALTTLATGSAAEQKLVRIDHGRAVTYALRPLESEPTIAVFAVGRSVGQSTMVESLDSERRDAVIQRGRGQTLHVARPTR